jgi:hypothetical protein
LIKTEPAVHDALKKIKVLKKLYRIQHTRGNTDGVEENQGDDAPIENLGFDHVPEANTQAAHFSVPEGGQATAGEKSGLFAVMGEGYLKIF